MSVTLRTAVRVFIVFALLAAVSCSGTTGLQLDNLTQPGVDSARAVSHTHGKSAHGKGSSCKPSRCKPAHSKHHSSYGKGRHHRSWHPTCRCHCTPHGTRNQPPVAGVALATTNGSTFELRPEGSSDPDGTIVRYEWDFESDGVYDFTSTTDGVTSHFFEGGPHSVTLRVTDNKGATATATFDLTANFPPHAEISLATVTGASFTFSAASSSDPEGAIQKWEWDFDGDGIFEEFYFSDPGSISHSFTGGPHEVSLRVTDGLDATDTETITVDANHPPVADIQVVNSAVSPDGDREFELAFDGSSDVEGPIFQFFVTVDGEPQSLANISDHLTVAVPAGETRNVVLTVLDGLDLSDSQIVALTPDGAIFAEE